MVASFAHHCSQQHHRRRAAVWQMDRSTDRRLRRVEETMEDLEADNAILRAQMRCIKDTLACMQEQLEVMQNCVGDDAEL